MSSRFEVLETLESHQRASLYRVRDARSGQEALIRRYHAEPDELEGQRELLDTMRALEHPNLERILEVGADEVSLFALVDTPMGMTLYKLLREGPLSEAEFEQVARQMLSGLAVLHERGIPHTALRPEVVRVRRPGAGQLELRIGGFGEGFGRKSETEPAEPAAYRCTAPEQWRGDAVGRRTDVYAAGCIFYEALAGKPPFKPDSINSLRAAHLANDMVPLAKEAPQVKPWISAWVMQLLDPDMNTRPRDASTARKLFELREHGMQQAAAPPQHGFPLGYNQPPGYPYSYPGYSAPGAPSSSGMVPLTRAISPQPATSTTAFQPVPLIPVAVAVAPPPIGPGAVTRSMAKSTPPPPPATPGQKKVLIGIGFAVAAIVVATFLLTPGKPVMASVAVRKEMLLPVPTGLLLHLDASRHEMTETTITNQVKRWGDPQDKTRFAAPPTPESGPTLVAAGLNELPVLDFGPFHSEHWMEFKKGTGTNKLSTIRSAFWVMRGSGFLLSDDQTWDFHRGDPEGEPVANIFGGPAAAGLKTGTVRLNGTVVKPLETPLPKDFSLVSLVTTAPLTASRLCKDRVGTEGRVGGQQIAEVLIYNRPLNDTEVKQVETYLRTKWLSP